MAHDQRHQRDGARSDAVILAVVDPERTGDRGIGKLRAGGGLDPRAVERPRELDQRIPADREAIGDEHDLGGAAREAGGPVREHKPASSSADSSASIARKRPRSSPTRVRPMGRREDAGPEASRSVGPRVRATNRPNTRETAGSGSNPS